MKKSIRIKLFCGVSILVIFFVLFSWILNTQYLGKYYQSQKEKNLIDGSEMIYEEYNGNPSAIYLELEKLERMTGVNIMILNGRYELKYSSGPKMLNELRRIPNRSPDLVSLIESKRSDLLDGKSIFITTSDPRMNSNFLYLVSLLNNQDLLILSTPLAAIRESAAVANRFFLFTGFLTIIIGIIIVFLFSKRFTRPFIELNEIAQGMAELDFSRKYDVQTDDEIGELGRSINCLSDQLDKSISELKGANQQLQKDIERERKIDGMRKEFVSSVSHELKTPIALIQGYAEGLKDNVVDDEENKNYYCSVIIDESAKMSKLVRDLLDLSRVESGFFPLERNVFEITSLVENILEKFSPLFSEKNICPVLEKPKDIDVDADIMRIEQVLVNFLNNAIQHINERKILKISVQEKDDKVRISVFNSGSPIPEDSLDKIWTSFYKVDKARTRSLGGTGLGLSIVRAIQELHQNNFGAVNSDHGVEFWFELDKVDASS